VSGQRSKKHHRSARSNVSDRRGERHGRKPLGRQQLRFEPLEARQMLSGLTIVTHGWEPGLAGTALPSWVGSMADQIVGSQPSSKRIDLDFDTGNITNGQTATLASGETVVTFNWKAKSDYTAGGNAQPGWREAAADFLANWLLGTGLAAAGAPIQFIGQGMGAVVVSEAIERLGAYAIQVDQMTTLDPHDQDQEGIADAMDYYVPGVVDHAWDEPRVTFWSNVAFVDNYWQDNAGSAADPTDNAFLPLTLAVGHTITGAANRDLTTQVAENAGDGDDWAPDAKIHEWYYKTVLGNAQPGGYGEQAGDNWYVVGTAIPATQHGFALSKDIATTRTTSNLTQLGMTTPTYTKTAPSPADLFNGAFRFYVPDTASGDLPGYADADDPTVVYTGGSEYGYAGKLDASNPGFTHRTVYFPTTASRFKLAFNVQTAGAGDTLRVTVPGLAGSLFEESIAAAAPGWQVREIAVPTALQGQAKTFAVEVVDGSSSVNSTVWVDNINIVQGVSIPDAGLEQAIRTALSKPTGPISEADLASLTTLNADRAGVANLEGLQYCTGLVSLYLNHNAITSISQLAGLTNLQTLELGDNQITSIASLAGLNAVSALVLDTNQISDISPLAGKVALMELLLNNNQISNLTAVEGMSGLVVLELENNLVTDLTSVVNSSGLRDPYLGAFLSLTGNPLSTQAVNVQIPQLEARGVTVEYDPNIAPTANAGGPYSGNEGSNIALSAAQSSDTDGQIVGYEWDLDNNGTYDATGVTTNFNSANDGTFTVRLRVTDNGGATGVTTATVTVANVAPNANAGSPYSDDIGTVIVLSAAGSTDAGNDIATYLWDLDNDGQYDDANGVTANFNATTKGTFSVGVRVTDNDGGSSTATTTVTVDNDTVALYDPTSAVYYLRNHNNAGAADWSFFYGPANLGWSTIAGDWNDNGIDTVGLYDPVSAVYYLRNVNAPGNADIAFAYGPPGAGWLPVVGDWNNDGMTTVGLFNPVNAVFYLRNTHAAGYADYAFAYGAPGAGWTPVIGDWDGDGDETVGLYDPTNAVFYLRNGHAGGVSDVAYAYGPPGLGWQPVVGDWNADGVDTVGLYNPTSGTFYLRNSHSPGAADVAFNYGAPGLGWKPAIGDWDDTGGALLAAGGNVGGAEDAAALTQDGLQAIVAQAIADWASAGVAAEQIEAMWEVRFVVTDLPGARLGLAGRDLILLDRDAAGHGWFVDSTPGDDGEFTRHGGPIDPGVLDRMDLLTVVSHELGHKLGLDDLDPSAGSLMSGSLETGVRREPGPAEIDALFGQL